MRAFLFIAILCISCSSLYGQVYRIEPDLHKADSVAQLYPKHPLNDLKVLSDKLTAPLSTDVEKFRSIFKWVCLNIESDYMLLKENKDKRAKLNNGALSKWEKKFSKRVFSILIDHHRTICTGYAYLVKELAFHAGLNCTIVNGYGRHARANIGGRGIVNHSWNAVELDGKWYLCDATWASGTIDGERKVFVQNFDEGYFLSDPALFGRSHYPVDARWMLQNEKRSLKEFLNAPLVYSGTLHYEVKPTSPTLFNIETWSGDNVVFQFTKGDGPEFSTAAILIDDFKTDDMFIEELSEGVGTFSANHTFLYRGRYAVHVVLDGSHVFSYNVRVR